MTATIYKSDLHDVTEFSTDPVLVGGEGLNMLKGTTFDYWKPEAVGLGNVSALFDAGSAIDIDYCAFDAHNLNEIDFSNISLRGSNASNFVGETFIASWLKSEITEGALLKHSTNTTAFRYYRVVIVASPTFIVAPIIGVCYGGLRLHLPSGIKPSYTPPRMGHEADVKNNISGTGNFIGRSLRRERYDFVIKNEHVQKAWIDANWIELRDYIQLNPFFYVWNDIYFHEVVFCWTVGRIAKPRFSTQIWIAFEFRCNGFL